ncbi:MAG: hypothetical protein ACRC0R_02640, partial [Cetobacterium sp.]
EYFYFGAFYTNSYKEEYLNEYEDIVGLFYKDCLLAYRMSVKCGDKMLYTYIENSISSVEADNPYKEEITKYIVNGLCGSELKSKIIESNLIADEIIKLKEIRKFKQAKSLVSNGKFLGTLESPKADKELALKILKELKTENEELIKGFINIRVKHLFLYKVLEYYNNIGISCFSVDAGIDEKLASYKKSLNTGRSSVSRFSSLS